MDAVQEFLKLGYTDYEARVYLALLKSPDSTGYEASRVSGVPRAKVYEVMESLDRKGAVMINFVDGRQLYRAVPPAMLIARHRRETEELLAELEPMLLAMENRQNPEALLTVRGQGHVNDLVRQLLRQAKARILLTGFPWDLKELAPEILACSKRGVKTFVLSYGPVVLEGAEVIEHSVSGFQYLQVAALGRWLAVIADHREAVLAQLTDGQRTSALWTRHPMVVFGISGWITHDITLFTMESLMSQVKDDIPPAFLQGYKRAMQALQPMWFLKEGEIPEDDLPVPQLEPEAVLKSFSRMDYRGLTGKISFVLHGQGGGYWLVELGAAGGKVTKESREVSGDLKVEMQVRDLLALVSGTLPMTAFMTPGRMKVEGNMELAHLLQDLSGMRGEIK